MYRSKLVHFNWCHLNLTYFFSKYLSISPCLPVLTHVQFFFFFRMRVWVWAVFCELLLIEKDGIFLQFFAAALETEFTGPPFGWGQCLRFVMAIYGKLVCFVCSVWLLFLDLFYMVVLCINWSAFAFCVVQS